MTLHRLDAGPSTLVVDCRNDQLSLCYLGSQLPPDLDLNELPLLRDASTPHGELDSEMLTLAFPTQDGYAQSQSALIARRNEHAVLSSPRVVKIVGTSAYLKINLRDERAKLELQMEIEAAPSGVFSSRCTVINTAEEHDLHVDWLASIHLMLPPSHREFERYGGFWGNELIRERVPLGQFAAEIGSMRGRSSHQSFPTLLCGEPGFTDQQKSVLLTSLAWSGNHKLRVEPSQAGGHSLQAGVALQTGELNLGPGEQWCSPAALFALSDTGINGIRQQFKRYWFDEKSISSKSDSLVHFNSWESSYFSHNAKSTCALIDAAASLGAERFVLDDGWMDGRVDIGCGLGDWHPCPERYPEGIGPVADYARQQGLSFGLWVEPEMLTLDSEIAREHPDWIIGAEGYAPMSGRKQHLLNLCLSEVRAHILGCLDRLIEDCNPDYLKWDMNRDYAYVGFGGPATPHGMTEAWYALLRDLRARHPGITVESCAAGGARNDAGALAASDRIWLSDSMDPLQRFEMMKHASSVLPPALLGTHVGASPSSTSGAHLPLSTRCILALLGHMGFELNPQELSDSDRSMLRRWSTFYKAERCSLAHADFYYLDETQPGIESLLVYNHDDARGLLFVVRRSYPGVSQSPIIQLPACVADAHFDMELLNPEDSSFVQLDRGWHCRGVTPVSGESLHHVGLRVPFLQIGHCALIQLRASRH